jgi:two-component system, NtrC family, sensor kinase
MNIGNENIKDIYMQDENEVFQSIINLLNQDLDINKIQLGFCELVHKLCQSEATGLLILDTEDKRLVQRKIYRGYNDWFIEDSFQIQDQSLFNKLVNKTSFYLDLLQPENEFDSLYELQDQPYKSALLLPLKKNSEFTGLIQAFNPKTEITSKRIELLNTIAKSFTLSMKNFDMVRMQKIDNANLEAWRWELLQSRNTLRAMFDSIPTSIYIVDGKYKIVAINTSRSIRAEQKPNNLVGQICYEVLYNHSQPCQGCRVNETFLSKKSTIRNDRQWIKNDQITDWEISTYAILDESDEPSQVIIFEQDVTQEKRLEANLIQSEKLAAVGQLAAGVAHEINNPLSAVIANAQLLRRDLPEDSLDARESVELIEIAGLRASQVVRNLMGFARKEQYDFVAIDLNETVLNALSLVKHELASRSMEIKTNLQEDLPMIHASKDHLQSVWINIILNALDSMESGKGVIEIGTTFSDEEFKVRFSDNGAGIPADKVTKIFEPFFTTKDPGRGTGLGLSICHRIVKQHGGFIQVDSLTGTGTTFTISLPRNNR